MTDHRRERGIPDRFRKDYTRRAGTPDGGLWPSPMPEGKTPDDSVG